jgi:hypothetical protein
MLLEESIVHSPYFSLYPRNSEIIFSTRGDVNGDGIIENVYLTGVRTPQSAFVQNITLLIQDGVTGRYNQIPLESNAGYNPTIILRDFTGDGVKGILVSIASGGSGGTMYYYVYSYLRNIPRLLFDYKEFNEKYKYNVEFKDYYVVEITSLADNTKFRIDISYKGPEYLNEIYDAEGRLREPIEGFVNPISGLYPIDFAANGVHELMAFQRIAGRYNADSLGFIQTILKQTDNRFDLVQQFASVYGAKAE